MPEIVCPPEESLRAFLLGQLGGSEADALAEHLASCSRCATRLPGLTPADPLLDLVRTPDPLAAHLRMPGVQRLLHRLHGLTGERHSRSTIACEPRTPSSAPPGETTWELAPFLDPPQHPGDIGQIGPFRLLEVIGAGG